MKKRFLSLIIGLCSMLPILAGSTLPLKLVNNSIYADNEIYVAIIGNYNGNTIYYDLKNNHQNNASLPVLNESVNTLTKAGQPWGFANIFTTLDQIKDKTIHLEHTSACRIFFSFKSPMYLHAFAQGYAGADFGNPGDPNHGIRWELIEFTYNDDSNIWINTTRVDAFQYPMGLELFGSASSGEKYIKRGELKTYSEIINRWNSQHGGDQYAACLQNDITSDNLGGIILQPSKVASVKNSGFMDSYINGVWNYFRSNDMTVKMGVLGTWRGRVNGDVFTLTCQEGNYFQPGTVATIPWKPSTTDAVEGAGAFATAAGTTGDLPVQAMFCGAFNRGVVQYTTGVQDWSPSGSNYFNMGNPCNEYVKFFHQTDLTHDGYTYAFAYDDTFDQSATCHTNAPASATVTIGGFAGIASGDNGNNNNNNNNNNNQGTATGNGVATFCQDINYGGYQVSLSEGTYTQAEMEAKGIRNNDISSLKVLPGYKVTVFDGSNFNNASKSWTGDTNWIGNDWNDRASSIKIEPNGKAGMSGTYKLQNRNSGKYADLDANRTDDNTAIVQWDDEGTELYQQWRLNEVEAGVYTIQAAATDNRGFDVAYASADNGAQVLLYTYNNGRHQQFILFDKGDGYYQLIARHCGKPVEMAGATTASGEWLRTYDNNGTNCQQWKLVKNNPAPSVAAAAAPNKAAENVLSVFSDSYQSQTPNLADGQWGQQTQSETVSLNGNNTKLFKNFNYMGLEYGKNLNVSSMENLHIDIYPTEAFTIKISPVSPGPNENLVSRDLKANQWNSIDIALSDFPSVNKAENFQLKFDGGSGQTLYIDNIYYWKAPAQVVSAGATGSYNVATFCQDINYGGYNISLPEGTYTQAQLESYGIRNNDISSLKVMQGFKVTVFDGSGFNNASKTFYGDTNWIGSDWNDRASSIKIEPNGASGLSGVHKLQNRNSGKYMDLDGNRTGNNTAVVQWDDEGTELYQQWRLNEVAPGVYTIQPQAVENRGLDVANQSTENSAQVLLWDYWGGYNQQFIAYDKGNGYYQFLARNSGKAIEMPGASTTSGEWVRIWDNNGTYAQQWLVKDVQEASANTSDTDFLATDGYQLVWSDEFDTNTLGTNWNVEVVGNPNNNEMQYYTNRASNVTIENGNLVLTARKESYGGKPFTSGRVNSQGKVRFTHGKIVARIKMPKTARGLWPAFWMMGDDITSVGWPKCGEIDIMEAGNAGGYNGNNEEKYFSGAIHWGEDWSQHQWWSPNAVTNDYSVQDDYHLFICEWDEEFIKCYLDQQTTPYYEASIGSQYGSSAYMHKPFHLLFNLAVGGDFPAIYDANGISALPYDGAEKKMYVDYVRVYQRSGNVYARQMSVTGIDNVDATANVSADADDSYYTLQGMKLTKDQLRPGIYIHKGKKILVK